MSGVVDIEIFRAFRALQSAVHIARIVSRRWTRLTRVSRRFRYAARCQCGKPATEGFSVETVWATHRLNGSCAECWSRDRQFTRWWNAFHARQSLVRRTIPYGDLQKQLLTWVRDTEQARAEQTWRKQPDPPRPPGPPNGGRRVRLAPYVAVEVFSERKAV